MRLIIPQPVNLDHPLNRGLVSWWKVIPQWRGGGTWRDLMRVNGANDVTLQNMDPTTDWVGSTRPGSWGALEFDGSNDFGDLQTNLGLSTASDFTMSVWQRVTAFNSRGRYVGLYDGADDIFQFGLLENDDNVYVRMGHIGGNEIEFNTTVNPLSANTWHMVTLVWTASDTTARIYVDGVEKASSSGAVDDPFDDAEAMDIGRRSDGGAAFHFPGRLDDVRIYNRAVSASEVRALFYASQERFSPLLRFRRSVGFVPVAGGTAVGVVTETDSPIAVSSSKAKSVGIVTETDSPLAVTSQKTVTAGIVTETDSPIAVAGSAKQKSVGVVTETDSPIAASSGIQASVGVVTETDSPIAIAGSAKAKSVNVVTETDSPIAAGSAKAKSVGVATETDSPIAATSTKKKTVGIVLETSVALAVSSAKAKTVGVVTETDSALGASVAGVVATADVHHPIYGASAGYHGIKGSTGGLRILRGSTGGYHPIRGDL